MVNPHLISVLIRLQEDLMIGVRFSDYRLIAWCLTFNEVQLNIGKVAALIWSWDPGGVSCYCIIDCWMVKMMIGLLRRYWEPGEGLVEENHEFLVKCSLDYRLVRNAIQLMVVRCIAREISKYIFRNSEIFTLRVILVLQGHS